MRGVKHVFLSALILLTLPELLSAAQVPSAKPEEVGLSSAKLDAIKPLVRKYIDEQKSAGVLTVVARRGKLVQLETFGFADIEANSPIKPDTIFRIYSMSKPITTVAAMILFEEGKFQLDDPVARFLPEFKGLQVFQDPKTKVELKRPVTVRDLMRHTAGLTYGIFGDTAVDKLYRDRKVLDHGESLREMVAKLGGIPLLYQPGTHFHYSVATDVLGRLVEVISGKSFDEFLEQRIFKPLDMEDTGFWVPKEKLSRLATNYGPKPEGGLHPIDVPATSEFRQRTKFLSGGGGLVSTARDYMRFCQMVLNGGELEGTRILRKDTVAILTKNQLPGEAMPLSMASIKRPGLGFGLGYSVRVAKSESEPGVVGEYGWGGAASTHFWISPRDELIVIILQQYMPFNARLEQILKPLIYSAIND